MGFVLLLLVISYIIIHRDAKNIKRYKRKTTDLIEQLEQSMQQNEVLITSRKKAVHTITHELRTPLTAITGCLVSLSPVQAHERRPSLPASKRYYRLGRHG